MQKEKRDREDDGEEEEEADGVCFGGMYDLCSLALNSRTQRDGSTESLHIRLVLAVVHGVKGALVACDAKLASH